VSRSKRLADVRLGSKGESAWSGISLLYPNDGHPPRRAMSAGAMNGLTLTWLLWKRMLEEETQHFPRCVRSSRISVGAYRAASRPCMSSSVDIPVLQDSAPTRVAMDSAGIGNALQVPARDTPSFVGSAFS